MSLHQKLKLLTRFHLQLLASGRELRQLGLLLLDDSLVHLVLLRELAGLGHDLLEAAQ